MRKAVANPVFWAKTLQCALLSLVVVAMLGAGESRFDHLGHELMCSCGCGQILLECNHVSCPDSPVMIRELHAQLASGASDKAILNWFVAKYGPTILAAPIRGGFDDAAWIVPFAVFVLATAGTFAIVWMWKRRYRTMVAAPALAGAAAQVTPEESALRERIRRETEY
jgi:cytochrome c-type biogenesis protein CcmH/NrfF